MVSGEGYASYMDLIAYLFVSDLIDKASKLDKLNLVFRNSIGKDTLVSCLQTSNTRKFDVK